MATQMKDNALDVGRIRADFPLILSDGQVPGRMSACPPLAYLDNAATSQKPRAVIDAVTRFYEHQNSNVHRGLYQLSADATIAYENARKKVAAFINASSADEVIFVRGATEAINLVAHCHGRANLGEGDEVLITEMEHHANIVPWQVLCNDINATLKVAPINDAGELIIEAFKSLLNERTRVVAFGHVSNALGSINPAKELIAMAKSAGAVTVVDGAQAVPHMKVDVRELDCDFYAFSGHKMFAPMGIGVLYGRSELLKVMPPYQTGGEMISSVTFEKTTYKKPPARFEAGTPNVAGAIGLAAAIDYLQSVGLDRIADYETALLHYATQVLQDIAGLRLIGTAKDKAAVLSFILPSVHPHDVATVLDAHAVAVRAGHHCAQPIMQHFNVPATTRASLCFYNTREEVDRLAAALRDALKMFAR